MRCRDCCPGARIVMTLVTVQHDLKMTNPNPIFNFQVSRQENHQPWARRQYQNLCANKVADCMVRFLQQMICALIPSLGSLAYSRSLDSIT